MKRLILLYVLTLLLAFVLGATTFGHTHDVSLRIGAFGREYVLDAQVDQGILIDFDSYATGG
jgi:hypothetical protein